MLADMDTNTTTRLRERSDMLPLVQPCDCCSFRTHRIGCTRERISKSRCNTKQPPLSVLSTEASDESDGFIGQIEAFLREAVESLDPEFSEDSSDKAGRPRVLPSLCLWSGLLVCVLRGFNSQLALWRLLTVQQLWSYPRFDLSDQAIYKRLGSGGTAVLEQLFEQISALLVERLEPYKETKLAPFASEIMALDGMTLDKIARLLPALRQLLPGDSQLLPGKLAGLFDIRRQ